MAEIDKLKQQRLKAYKKALRHYKLSKSLSFLGSVYDTNCGFCYYFGHHSINQYVELMAQEPADFKTSNRMYWFPEGANQQRIDCLKEAIKLCSQ